MAETGGEGEVVSRRCRCRVTPVERVEPSSTGAWCRRRLPDRWSRRRARSSVHAAALARRAAALPCCQLSEPRWLGLLLLPCAWEEIATMDSASARTILLRPRRTGTSGSTCASGQQPRSCEAMHRDLHQPVATARRTLSTRPDRSSPSSLADVVRVAFNICSPAARDAERAHLLVEVAALEAELARGRRPSGARSPRARRG